MPRNFNSKSNAKDQTKMQQLNTILRTGYGVKLESIQTVKNSTKDPCLGMNIIPSQARILRNTNKPVQSIREKYVSSDGRILCVPAIRVDLVEFGEMLAIGIDVTNLTIEAITTAFYLHMHKQLYFSNGTNFNYRFGHDKFLGGVRRYYPQNDSDYRAPDSQDKGFARSLSKWVKNNGGIKALLVKAVTKRFDAMGYLSKDFNAYPCGRVPIARCACCGMFNILSYSDGGAGSPASHKNHVPGPYYDDSNILNINEGVSPWRCSYCMAELDITIENQYADFIISLIELNLWCYIAGDLDKLMTVGVLDSFPDIDENTRNSIEKHDLAVYRNQLRNYKSQVVPIGADMPEELVKYLSTDNQVGIFRQDYQHLSNNPTLLGELNSCLSIKAAKYRSDKTVCHIGEVVNIHKENNHYLEYNSWLTNMFKSNKCCVSNECKANITNFSFGLAGLSKSLKTILKTCTIGNGTYITLPLLTNPAWHTHVKDNSLYLMVDGLSNSLHLNYNTVNALHNHDVIVNDGVSYIIKPICEYTMCKIVNVSVTNLKHNINHRSSVKLDETVKVRMPRFNTMLPKHMQAMLVSPEYVDLNVELFNTLCRRDLTGSLSLQALTDFGTGWALTRYSTLTTQIERPKVTAEQVLIASFLAKLTMEHLRDQFDYNTAFIKQLKKLGPFTAPAMHTTNTVFKSIKTAIADFICSSLNIKDASIYSYLTLENVSKWVVDYESDNNVATLLDLRKRRRLRGLRTHVEGMEESAVRTVRQTCNHHNFACKHKGPNTCRCCLAPCQDTHCKCCKTMSEHVHASVVLQQPKSESSKTAITNSVTFKTKGMIECRPLVERNVALEGDKHIHVCSNCLKKYSHAHPYRQLQHPMYVGDCPWCEGNTSSEKVQSVPVAPKLNISDSVQPTLSQIYQMANTLEAEDMPIDAIFNAELDNNIFLPQVIRTGVISIPRLVKGEHMFSPFLKIESEHDPTPTGEGRCALDALEYITNNTYEDRHLQLNGINTSWLDSNDLSKLCYMYDLNIGIITKDMVDIIKASNKDEIYLLSFKGRHDQGHFSAPVVTITEEINYYKCINPDIPNEWREPILKSYGFTSNSLFGNSDVPPATNKVVENIVASTNQNFNEMVNELHKLEEYKLNNLTYVTNNSRKEHKPSSNLYNVPIEPNRKGLLLLLNSDCDTVLNNPKIMQTFNRDKMLPQNADSEILNIMGQHIRVIKEVEKDFKAHKYANIVKQYVNTICNTQTHISTIKINEPCVKAGDLILIEANKQHSLMPVIYSNNSIIITKNLPTGTRKITIGVLKISVGSTLQKLMRLASTKPDTTELSRLLRSCEYHKGVPGSGKSRHIVETAQPGDIVTSLTRTGHANVSSFLKPGVKTMSLEKLSNMESTKIPNLFIDECTMVDWTDMLVLTKHKINKLYLYGDENQIGNVDMYRSGGLRLPQDVTNYVPPNNIIPHSSSNRIGYPMAEQLCKLNEGFAGNSGKTTNLKIVQLQLPVGDKALRKIVNDGTVGAVITWYNSVKTMLTGIVTSSKIHVDTIHRTQSREFDHVVVVHMSEINSGANDLLRDKKYLYSALTRAGTLTTLVIINYPVTVTSIDELTAYRGGLLDHIPPDLSFNTMCNNREFMNSLMDVNLVKWGSNTIQFLPADGGITCQVSSPLGEATITNKEGQVIVEGSMAVKAMIKKHLDTPWAQHSTEMQIFEKDIESPMQVKTEKLRKLCWMVDMALDQKLPIRINNELHYIYKTPGCPLMCGIKFSKAGKDVISIGDGYQHTRYRTVERDLHLMYDPIINWFTHNTSVTNTWLDAITCNKFENNLMLKERLGHTITSFMDMVIAGRTKGSYTSLEFEVFQEYKQLCKNINKQVDVNRGSVVKHELYYELTITKLFWYNLTLYDKTNVINRQYNLNLKECIEYIQDCYNRDLATVCGSRQMREIPMLSRFIGGNNNYIIPLAEHINSRTRIGLEAIKTATKVKLMKQLPVNQMLNVPEKLNPMMDDFKTNYGYSLPYSNIPDSKNGMGDFDRMLESICILKYCSRGDDSEILYGGSHPSLLIDLNKMYCKVLSVNAMERHQLHVNRAEYDYINKHFYDMHMAIKLEDVPKLSEIDTVKGQAVTCLGLNLSSCTTESLFQLLKQTKEISGIICTPDSSYDKYYSIMQEEDNSYRVTNNQELLLPINKDLMVACQTGKPIEYDDMLIVANSNKVLFGHHLATVTMIRKQSVYVHLNNNNLIVHDMIEVTLPTINTNIRNWVLGDELFSMQKYRVNSKLYRMMRLRLLTGDDDMNSLLVYSRTLASTQVATSDYISQKHDINIPSLYATAVVAKYMHDNVLGSITKLCSIVEAWGPVINNVNYKQQLLTGVVAVDEILQSLLSKFGVEPIMDKINNFTAHMKGYIKDSNLANLELLINHNEPVVNIIDASCEDEGYDTPDEDVLEDLNDDDMFNNEGYDSGDDDVYYESSEVPEDSEPNQAEQTELGDTVKNAGKDNERLNLISQILSETVVTTQHSSTAMQDTILVISNGSYGDLLPILSICKILMSMGEKILFCTHHNHADHIPKSIPTRLLKSDWAEHTANALMTYGGLNVITNKMLDDALRSKIEFCAVLEWEYSTFKGVITSTITPCQHLLGKRFRCPVAYMCAFNMPDCPIMQPMNDLKQRLIIDFNVAVGFLDNGYDKFLKQHDYKKYERDSNVWMDNTNVLITNTKELCINVSDHYSYCGPISLASPLTTQTDVVSIPTPYVVMTFGSLATGSLLDVMMDLLRQTLDAGMRVVFVSCGLHKHYTAKLTLTDSLWMRSSKNLTIFEYMDYGKILPNCTFMLHHGGVGTMLQAIKHKTPSIIWPIFGDQYTNGRLVQNKGFGLTHEKSCIKTSDYGPLLETMMVKSNTFRSNLATSNVDLSYNEEVIYEWLYKNLRLSRPKPKEEHQTDLFKTISKYTNNDEYKLKPGRYTTSMQNSVTFSPDTVNKCVYKCFAEQHKNDGRDTELTSNWYDLSEESNIITSSFLNGYNLHLCVGCDTTVYIWCEEWPSIKLALTTDGMISHCSIFEYSQEPAFTPSEIVATPPETILKYNEVYNFVKLYWPETTNGIDSPAIKHVCRAYHAMKARLNTNQYLLIYNRTNTPIFLWKPTSNHRIYIVEPKIKDANWAVVMYHSNKGWMTGVLASTDTHTCMITLSDETPDSPMLMNMMAKLQVKLPPKLEPKITDRRHYSLNRETQVILINNKVNTDLYKGNLQEQDVLHIEHYDNRKHHNNNVEVFNKQKYGIIWNKNMTTKLLKEMQESHNHPVNRLCLWKGQVRHCTESSNEVLTTAVLKMHKSNNEQPHVVGDSIHTINKIDGYMADKLKAYAHGNKLVAKAIELKEWAGSLSPDNLKNLLDTLEVASIDELEPRSNVSLSEQESFKVIDDGWVITNTYAKNVLCVATTGKAYAKLIVGGALNVQSRIQWKFSELLRDPTKFIMPSALSESPDKIQPVHDVMALNLLNFIEDQSVSLSICGDHMDGYEPFYEAPLFSKNYSIESSTVDLPSDIVIRLWQDLDLTDWVTMSAPSKGRLQTREEPNKIVKFTKTTLTKYPIMSRPVLSRIAYDEMRAVSQRLHGMEQIRKQFPKPNVTLSVMAAAWFHDNCWSMMQDYQNATISYTAQGTATWLNEHPQSDKKYQALIGALAGELETKPFNDVNVHTKMESLLKSQPIHDWKEHKSRIIVWQEYIVAAIFSPIFLEAKLRLKSLLHKRVKYADGLQPYEIAALVRTVTNVSMFMENDLTLQDKQTDKPLLDTEMLLYKMLGVNENVLSVWRYMHVNWRYKGKFTRGNGTLMRQSGQATTAVGNFITNLQVHSDFALANKPRIELTLVLGDDILFFLNSTPNIRNLRANIASKFNMQCKEDMYEHHGTFCRLVAYKTLDGCVGMGPDFIRLKNRYEVTNGMSEASDENMKLRTVSYCCMLGKTKETMTIVDDLGIEVDLEEWYDYPHLVEALSHKYNIGVDQVEGHYTELINMMENRKVFHHDFRGFGSKLY